MLIRLNGDQVRAVGLWGSADMGTGQHGDGLKRVKMVRPKRVGPKWVEPMRERRRQLSLENSKINQIK